MIFKVSKINITAFQDKVLDGIFRSICSLFEGTVGSQEYTISSLSSDFTVKCYRFGVMTYIYFVAPESNTNFSFEIEAEGKTPLSSTSGTCYIENGTIYLSGGLSGACISGWFISKRGQ